MTSNIGAQEGWHYRAGFERGWRSWLRQQPRAGREKAMVEAALHRHFEPEFLNRIDRIRAFERLGGERLPDLLAIELDKLNQRLGRHGRRLEAEYLPRDPQVTRLRVRGETGVLCVEGERPR